MQLWSRAAAVVSCGSGGTTVERTNDDSVPYYVADTVLHRVYAATPWLIRESLCAGACLPWCSLASCFQHA